MRVRVVLAALCVTLLALSSPARMGAHAFCLLQKGDVDSIRNNSYYVAAFNSLLRQVSCPNGGCLDDVEKFGEFGDKTEQVVKDVQKFYNLPVTGKSTTLLWDKMVEDMDLAEGADRDWAVRAVQYCLNSEDHEELRAYADDTRLVVAPNGQFGPATTLAVKAFQRRNDLGDTGVVDYNTWRALFRGSDDRRANTAYRVLADDRITLAEEHLTKDEDLRTDMGVAKVNVMMTADGLKAQRSVVKPAPGGDSHVDNRLLHCLLAIAKKHRVYVQEIVGGLHGSMSAHYEGRAFSLTKLDDQPITAPPSPEEKAAQREEQAGEAGQVSLMEFESNPTLYAEDVVFPESLSAQQSDATQEVLTMCKRVCLAKTAQVRVVGVDGNASDAYTELYCAWGDFTRSPGQLD